MEDKIVLRIANGIDYIEQVKNKIAEYSTRLGRDLSFQHIDEELSNPETFFPLCF